MRILHVISDENVGGAGVLLTTLLRNLDRDRVESVVALPAGSRLLGRLSLLHATIRPLRHACDRYSIASVRELSRLIREENADLVHANAALCARIAGRRCGVGVVHTRHCCFPPSGIWRMPPLRRLGGIWNRNLSDLVIATADAAAENLSEMGIPQSMIRVIINGSEEIRKPSERELEALRARYGIKSEDFVIGICARLEPYKGHRTLLEAVKLLLESHEGLALRVLVIGDGSERQALTQEADRLGVSHAVCFTGFVADMAPIYGLLRINVNCSMGTETSCLALSEGFSAGVPAVASDFGGNTAMIGESEAGIVFPAGDARALADAILSIAQSPERERTMRRAARVRYEDCFRASDMAERVTAVYEELMRRRGGG